MIIATTAEALWYIDALCVIVIVCVLVLLRRKP